MQREGVRRCFKIALVSFFALYLEVALIRWISTEIRVFAYFKNLTLIACFLGLGLGCLLAGRKRIRFAWTFLGTLGLVAAIALPKRLGYDPWASITEALGRFEEMPLWTWAASAGLAGHAVALSLLVLLFLYVTLLFVPAGQLLGRWTDESANKIAAYSANIAGSLAGVAFFTLVSLLWLPPVAWFVTILAVGLLFVEGGRQRAIAIGLAIATASLFLATAPRDETVLWSPYQKIAYREVRLPSHDGADVPGGYLVRVNETFYQRISDQSPRYLESHRELFPESIDSRYLSYDLPYRVVENPRNVLVVGAGSGNDVAAALRNGAGYVDAVEIDPSIVEIGRSVHPERPYDDPRVSVHVDDARSFFKKTSRSYDLIVFGALDSHTLSSTHSNVRLDNFVYTTESFTEARRLLTESGLMVVVFSAEQPFIFDRLHAMITAAFGHEPVAFRNREIRKLGPAGGGPTLFVDRHRRIDDRIRSDPRLAAIVEGSPVPISRGVAKASDDWPYLYLERAKIPRLYLVVMAAIVVTAGLLVRPFLGELKRIEWHFFFLGAAFLLVEVQSISKMALLFGTTWIVNALVISAILVMILLANFAATRLRGERIAWTYAALIASLVLSYAFPLSVLLSLPTAVKIAIAGGLLSLPVFFAGLVFVRTFAVFPASGVALGSNLLGAIVGGAFESTSFVLGLNALGLVAAGFYGCSFALWLVRRNRSRVTAERTMAHRRDESSTSFPRPC